MRNSVSDDYFSFMSERGKGKNPPPEPRPSVVVPPPPSVPSTLAIAAIRAESHMEVTESSITDAMIQQMFGLGHTDRRQIDEASETLDE